MLGSATGTNEALDMLKIILDKNAGWTQLFR